MLVIGGGIRYDLQRKLSRGLKHDQGVLRGRANGLRGGRYSRGGKRREAEHGEAPARYKVEAYHEQDFVMRGHRFVRAFKLITLQLVHALCRLGGAQDSLDECRHRHRLLLVLLGELGDQAGEAMIIAWGGLLRCWLQEDGRAEPVHAQQGSHRLRSTKSELVCLLRRVGPVEPEEHDAVVNVVQQDFDDAALAFVVEETNAADQHAGERLEGQGELRELGLSVAGRRVGGLRQGTETGRDFVHEGEGGQRKKRLPFWFVFLSERILCICPQS